MKKKYFLRGLGTGILLTALILCISYRNQETGGDVVQQAKKLGMVFPEGTAEPENPIVVPTMTSAVETTTAPPVEDKTGSGAGVTVTETKEPTVKPTEKPTTKPTTKPTKKPVKTSENTNLFTVRGGLLSSSVARELKEAGMIQNDDAFDEYLEKNGYGKDIRAGTYKIPKGASYREIARIITRQD